MGTPQFKEPFLVNLFLNVQTSVATPPFKEQILDFKKSNVHTNMGTPQFIFVLRLKTQTPVHSDSIGSPEIVYR